MSKNIQDLTFAKGIDPKDIEERKIFVQKTADRTFAEFGHLQRNLLAPNNSNEIDFARGYRYWEQNETFKGILGPHQILYPHEAVYQQLTNNFKETLKDTGMRIAHEYSSHKGFSHYWECLSDRFDQKIKDSYKVGDVVQIGMVVRNGIGTNIALGIDYFTYRLACLNGAISASTSAGNIRFSHVGSYEHMKDRFLQAIPLAIEQAKRLIKYYQQMVYVRTNQKIAEDLFTRLRNHVSTGYFPDNFNIDTDELKKDEPKISKVVNLKDDRSSLWETFNEFTQGLWHSNRLAFTGVRNAETALHRAVIAQIPNRAVV